MEEGQRSQVHLSDNTNGSQKFNPRFLDNKRKTLIIIIIVLISCITYMHTNIYLSCEHFTCINLIKINHTWWNNMVYYPNFTCEEAEAQRSKICLTHCLLVEAEFQAG